MAPAEGWGWEERFMGAPEVAARGGRQKSRGRGPQSFLTLQLCLVFFRFLDVGSTLVVNGAKGFEAETNLGKPLI